MAERPKKFLCGVIEGMGKVIAQHWNPLSYNCVFLSQCVL